MGKKHEKIRKEILRMQKADELYCDINNIKPNEFIQGKQHVYQDLINFIEKL